ncbi:response regulator [Cecembia sp.]|uniref:response regulator transcription factor n=1 Tax=Cecembia sp. TaxID=1898110 RepID=UPI0025C0309C|nr:response regulator [Cecembia sp.]
MKQILVIEDDRLISSLVTFKLKKEGYNITVATNGKEGINLFNTVSPDLLITDVLVPREDGVEIIDYVKEKKPDCPVIVLSTEGDKEDFVKEALNSGASDHMAKPFHPNELASRVRNLMRN